MESIIERHIDREQSDNGGWKDEFIMRDGRSIIIETPYTESPTERLKSCIEQLAAYNITEDDVDIFINTFV